MNNKILSQAKNKRAGQAEREPAKAKAAPPQSLRARSASKEYQQFVDYQRNWRDREKQAPAKEQGEAGALRADAGKPNSKLKNSSSAYPPTNRSNAAQ